MKCLSIWSVLVVSLALQMSSASASVGKVLYTFGVVTVETPAVQKLEKGSVLDAGHIIVTGPKGYAQLLLEDGTKIAIRPGSRFVIESLEMPAAEGQPAIGEGKVLRASFALQKGGFRTITGRISKRDPAAYQVSTPSAVIGVRGTLYSARMCSGDCSGGSADGL
ncbi:FecR domain-containing protein, partial [Pseudomonadales bacterium]|nr:FecR domain-containing protein [Pseudomonadales bacterium]